MTQQKYKVGDEVLIRAKVVDFDESDPKEPYLIEKELNGFIKSALVSEKEIYSLAPEFNVGEEITVIKDGKV